MDLNNLNTEVSFKKSEEAKKWLCALELSPEDNRLKEEFSHWLTLDVQNEPAYIEQLVLWDDIAISLRENLPIEGKPADENIEEINPEKVVPIAKVVRKKRESYFSRYRTIAACVFFIAVLLGIMSQLVDSSAIKKSDFQTLVAQKSEHVLSDGTTVYLNVESALDTDFDIAKRNIELLAGEVFFEVAKDVKRPFTVKVDEMEITAIGTAFNIEKSENWSKLELTHGSVSAKFAKNEIVTVLQKGQQIRWRNDSGAQEISNHYLGDKPNWMRGVLRVNEMPLSDLLLKLNEHYPIKLQLIDPRKRGLKVTGSIPLNDLESIKILLKEVLDVSHIEVFNNILLFY